MTHEEETRLDEMYERIKQLTEKMRAKYPINIDGLEPALTSDIAEIVLEMNDALLNTLIEEVEKMLAITQDEAGNYLVDKGDILPLLRSHLPDTNK